MAQGSKALLPPLDRLNRMGTVERAGKLMGGQRELAEAMGVRPDGRAVRAWVSGEREISDGVMTDAAAALEVHASACRELARRMRDLAGAGHLNIDATRTAPATAPSPALVRFRKLSPDLQMRVAKKELTIEQAEASDA